VHVGPHPLAPAGRRSTHWKTASAAAMLQAADPPSSSQVGMAGGLASSPVEEDRGGRREQRRDRRGPAPTLLRHHCSPWMAAGHVRHWGQGRAHTGHQLEGSPAPDPAPAARLDPARSPLPLSPSFGEELEHQRAAGEGWAEGAMRLDPARPPLPPSPSFGEELEHQVDARRWVGVGRGSSAAS
jgi:hypothetical protein